MSKPYSSYNPKPPERCFKAGSLVRWNPPDGAYSPRSAQYQVSGQAGLFISYYSDDMAFVAFNAPAVLCNTAYLEKIGD
jgi:hypothetical protein